MTDTDVVLRSAEHRVRPLGPADRPAVERLLEAEPVVRLALRALVEEALESRSRIPAIPGVRSAHRDVREAAAAAAADGAGAAAETRPGRVDRTGDSEADGRRARRGSGAAVNGLFGLVQAGVLLDVCYRSAGGGVLATVSSETAGRVLGAWLAERRDVVVRLVTDRLSGERLIAGFVAAGGHVLLQRPQLLYWTDAAAGDLDAMPELRLARVGEAATIARLGLAMDQEDVPVPGGGRRRPSARHVALVRDRILAGRVYVVEENGKIVFKADACCVGPRGAQVEGVYTIPRCRCRGLASRAMGAIASRLLREAPFVSLHVASANQPARRAYERAGFRFHSDHFLAVLAG